MSPEEALLRIGRSAADATANVLATHCGDRLERGAVAIAASESSPLQGVPWPALATKVSYVDGVSGGNVFVITRPGVRKLAALMMGLSPDDVEGDEEPSELELSAAAEAANQMMAATAAATATVLGLPVEISPPQTDVLFTDADAERYREPAVKAIVSSFSIAGEPCRLVQFVPHAFVVRMTRAFSEYEGEPYSGAGVASSDGAVSPLAVRSIPVRVTVEVGRARLPIGVVVGLRHGAMLELDRLVSDPVDILVNGRPYATGHLVLDDDQLWAVELEAVNPRSEREGD